MNNEGAEAAALNQEAGAEKNTEHADNVVPLQPNMQKQLQVNPEDLRERVTVYPSFLFEWRRLVGAALLCVFVSMLAYSVPRSIWFVSIGDFLGLNFGLAIPIAAILPLLMLGWAVKNRLDRRYVLSWRSLVCDTGLMSFKRRHLEVEFSKIYTLEVEQTLLQQLMGIGSVRIAAYVPDGDGLTLEGVRNPAEVKAMIERRIAFYGNANGG